MNLQPVRNRLGSVRDLSLEICALCNDMRRKTPIGSAKDFEAFKKSLLAWDRDGEKLGKLVERLREESTQARIGIVKGINESVE